MNSRNGDNMGVNRWLSPLIFFCARWNRFTIHDWQKKSFWNKLEARLSISSFLMVHWWRSLYLSMQSGSDIVRHSEITSKWRFSFSSLETPGNWSEHALMYFKAYLRVLIIFFQELSIYPFCEHPANSNLKIKTKNVNWL